MMIFLACAYLTYSFAQLVQQVLLNEVKGQLSFQREQWIVIDSTWLPNLKTITQSFYGNMLSIGMIGWWTIIIEHVQLLDAD